MKVALWRLFLCLVPLALTPLWGWLIADNYLNFGGGEKDLLLLIPWILWSTLYSIIFVVAWVKHLGTKAILLWSVGGATGVLVVVWVVMYFWASGLLGVGG